MVPSRNGCAFALNSSTWKDRHMTKRAITRELARYIVGLTYDDLPGATIEAAKQAMLDQLGVILLGSTLPWTQASYKVIQQLGGTPESTIIGLGWRTSVPDAA